MAMHHLLDLALLAEREVELAVAREDAEKVRLRRTGEALYPDQAVGRVRVRADELHVALPAFTQSVIVG
jgi:hypothetical protein